LNEYLQVLRSEWLIIGIIFALLFIKVGAKEWKNEQLLNLINIVLLVNLIIGFIQPYFGTLFDGMFFPMS